MGPFQGPDEGSTPFTRSMTNPNDTTSHNDVFMGDKRVPPTGPLMKTEQRFISWLVPKMPLWIEGYHLTLMAIPLSALLILSGYLARTNLQWLWLSSAVMALHWFTDSFDGATGKYRETGIPKWGYYMDHLLDYVFASLAVISYTFLVAGTSKTLLFLLAPIFGIFFVNSYLSMAATKEFRINFLGMGGTLLRLIIIVANTLIIVFGARLITLTIPFFLLLSVLFACVIVYRTQKHIWNIDMCDKAQRA